MPALIPHSRPTLSEADLQAVAAVIRSGQLAQGQRVQEFEEQFATFLGRKGAVATNSGTAALHLALLALEIGAGDAVVCPSYVCMAVLQAIRYVGAVPVLVDIDPHTFNLCPRSVGAALTAKTKAIVVPHLFGLPADLDELAVFGLPLIEDCAQTFGGQYRHRKVGSVGTVAIFSFYATKLLCTGEGGMVVADAPEILARLRDLRDYDERSDDRLRFNYKLTDMQAALGLSQLARLPAFLQRRREIAARYCLAFSGLPVQLPHPPEDREHLYYRFVITVSPHLDSLQDFASRQAISCRRPIFRPLHRYLDQPGFPATEAVWSQALSIPLYPSLTEEEVERIISCLQQWTA
ncbi:MAG: DegT/DnrJ/EryC1/StrS family aminotransferase [Deltaproteobacteria bacterium]|nr:DegT/DnrJ/EryC1/StrS family aminotransferase [Deltaproteobacteria bacterium]